jgi:hypothetical protein
MMLHDPGEVERALRVMCERMDGVGIPEQSPEGLDIVLWAGAKIDRLTRERNVLLTVAEKALKLLDVFYGAEPAPDHVEEYRVVEVTKGALRGAINMCDDTRRARGR